MTIVWNVVYRDGVVVEEPATLEESFSLAEDDDGFLVWVSLDEPKTEELLHVARLFSIHDHAIEDALDIHHRPKLKRYGATLFTTLLSARYKDETEEVEFSELHVFTGAKFVITIRHGQAPDLTHVRRDLEHDPAEIILGSEGILYAIISQVLDEYAPVAVGLENDIDEIENQLFAGDASLSKRIFDLSREIIDFQRATHPLSSIINGLKAGYEKFNIDPELRYELRDIDSHATRIIEQVDSCRMVLQNALVVQSTLATQKQNEEMQKLTEEGLSQNQEVKKISGWAAILFAPSLVAGIYGMNFLNIPLMHNRFGFGISILMMVGVSLSMYAIFKKKRWL